MNAVVQLSYLVATVLFIFALHWMNAPVTARKGVYAGVAAMLIAIGATWAQPEVVHHGWIILAIGAGVLVGVPLSMVPLTAVPQRTALSHAFGGLAAGLVGTAKYYLWYSEGPQHLTTFRMAAIIVEIILGYLTFTGSLLAAGKLQEVKWIPQRPVTYPLQNVTNIGLLVVALVVGVALMLNPGRAMGAGALSGGDSAGAGLRCPADHPDRRGRYADGHRHSQFLRRPGGRGDGIRPRQQAPDHGRSARWR